MRKMKTATMIVMKMTVRRRRNQRLPFHLKSSRRHLELNQNWSKRKKLKERNKQQQHPK